MSGDAGSVKFEVPSGVQTQLDQANVLIQQEQQRLQSLQMALTQGLPSAYQAIGYNPYSQSPVIGQMVGEILAGQTTDFSRYSQPQGQAPTPVAAPSGARPIDYQTEFQQKGYKNWGKNDDAANAARSQQQAAWDRQNQAYQTYQAQLNAYNVSGMSPGQFHQYYQQAQIQANLLKQALGTPEQLQAEQSVLKQIGEKLQQAPQLMDQLNQQLASAVGQLPQFVGDLQSQLGTAIGNMPQFLDQLNAQLGEAIKGSPEWQTQYKAANDALISYQNYADKVISGEVPYDPMVIQTLKEQTDATKGQLMKNLGTGWETSSPAIEAMAKNQQYTTAVLESERRKDISTALGNVQTAAGTVSSLEAARQAQVQNTQASIQQQYAQRMANIAGTQGALANQWSQRFGEIFGTQQAAGTQLGQYQQEIAGLLDAYNQMQSGRYGAMSQLLGVQGAQQQMGGALAGTLQSLAAQPYSVDYSNLAQLYQQGAGILGGSTIGSQDQPTNWAGLLQGVGSLAGGVAGLGLAFSDRRLKDVIVARYDEEGREEIAGVPTYDYRYIGDEETRYTGVMHDEAEAIHPEAAPHAMIAGHLIGMVDYGKLADLAEASWSR